MKDFPNIPSLPFLFEKGPTEANMSETGQFEQMIKQGATMLRAMMTQMPEHTKIPNLPLDREDGKGMPTEISQGASKQVDYYFLRNQQPAPTSGQPQRDTEGVTSVGRSSMLTGASAFN